jgi:hypothetical protein
MKMKMYKKMKMEMRRKRVTERTTQQNRTR